jgi:hypothetical protein
MLFASIRLRDSMSLSSVSELPALPLLSWTHFGREEFCITGCITSLMSELNVRIDPEMAALLERIARQTGRTKSEVVRDALETLRARHSGRG